MKTIPNLPPTTTTPATSSSIAGLIVGLTFSIIAAGVITLLGQLVFPQFDEVFASFGTDLPLLTQLLLHHYLVFWLAPGLVALIYFFWPQRKYRALAAGLTGLFTLIVAIPLVFIGIYLPIFNLAAAV